MPNMTIFYLISSTRGEDMSAQLISAHLSLEGAERALKAWAEDHYPRSWTEYLAADGRSFISEDDAVFLESYELED